jgi:hypothetical protein
VNAIADNSNRVAMAKLPISPPDTDSPDNGLTLASLYICSFAAELQAEHRFHDRFNNECSGFLTVKQIRDCLSVASGFEDYSWQF